MAKQTQYEAFLKLETGTHTARINQLLVSPDQKSLITAGSDKTIRVWDIESKTMTRMLLGQIGSGPRGSIQRIAITPDGKYLAVLAWIYPGHSEDQMDRDSELRVYNLLNGNLQARFDYKGTLQDVDISPNGQFVLIVGNKRNEANGRDAHLYIFNAKSILKGFGELPNAVAFEAIHNENSLIPANAQFIPDKNKKPAEFKIAANTWIKNGTGKVKWFSFTPSGKISKLVEKETEGLSPQSLTVSNEYMVITAHHDTHSKNLYCYDHSGKLLSVTSSEASVAQPAFSKDGKQLIVGQRGDSALNQVKVFNVVKGELHLESTYYGHDSEAVAAAILENGIAVSAGGDQNDIHFWNTDHIEGERVGLITGVGRTIHALGINEKEQIGIGLYDGLKDDEGRIVLQRLFDLQTMTLRISTVEDNASYRRSQREFGNFGLIWHDENANLWLTESGTPTTPLTGTRHPIKSGWIWYYPPTFGFTQNGSIITGANDGKIRVTHREIDYQTPLRLLSGGFAARVNDHAASSKWLVTGGADQIVRLWFMDDVEEILPGDVDPDCETLSPALHLFIGSDDEWVIWSKSGFYNASHRGDRRFGYHINRGSDQEALFYPSDRFIKSFFRPDFIQAILEHGSEERALAAINKDGNVAQHVDVSATLPPIVDIDGNGFVKSKDGKKVDIEFSVESLSPDAEIKRIWIVQNDKFVWEKNGPGLESSYKVEKLPLESGLNRFKILAETEFTKSMPLINTVDGPKQIITKTSAGGAKGSGDTSSPSGLKENGVLYILAVGVAHHEDKASNVPDLQFPAVDATGIFNAFGWSNFSSKKPKTGTRKNKAFRSVEAVLLTNNEGTKKAILEEVEKICKKIEKNAKANPNQRDVLLVFLSGHGVPGKDASNPELYFWNYDFVLSKREKTGLSFIELGKRITSLPAEVILATDACHSGMAGADVVRGLDPNELAKRLYAINERGLYVLNATRSSDTAWELENLGHGVFTWSILHALQNDSDSGMSMMKLMDSLQTTLAYTERQIPVFRMYGDLLPLTVFKK